MVPRLPRATALGGGARGEHVMDVRGAEGIAQRLDHPEHGLVCGLVVDRLGGDPVDGLAKRLAPVDVGKQVLSALAGHLQLLGQECRLGAIQLARVHVLEQRLAGRREAALLAPLALDLAAVLEALVGLVQSTHEVHVQGGLASQHHAARLAVPHLGVGLSVAEGERLDHRETGHAIAEQVRVAREHRSDAVLVAAPVRQHRGVRPAALHAREVHLVRASLHEANHESDIGERAVVDALPLARGALISGSRGRVHDDDDGEARLAELLHSLLGRMAHERVRHGLAVLVLFVVQRRARVPP
mmetsp:Transcript_4444/g.17846  ORF Transcript_4444/g.17846 Transcript_4444/m.17846 type:complete len:300 (+) Transcript_4444:1999-2898(+)